uniref:Trypsin inhibitor 5 n=1 Tax=Luffa aegyptiaca TaxID=3670 RepID=ITR5_LUFAE|nr:RecName: Full=Trypsin inhibitor 5; AltName: Full=TGT-II; AltName: Full=Trypsin inhibitor II; Flags: Precursor [Luffa aegyptiaca]AAA33407.1 trypsin inhibitor [Luffa aegyptiaca]
MASVAESSGVVEVIELISDGGNDLPRKIMSGRHGGICPRILMPCKTDDDCMLDCRCLSNGYCG